jgi:release factor glutamine methyltransferase
MQKYKDIKFETHLQVYQPAEDTYLLADSIKVNRLCDVLEIGTGTGIIAIIAAQRANKVIATDINPHAIDCAVKNLITNKTYNVELRKGDLFEPVKEGKFDLILFNTPYLPSDEDDKIEDTLDAAWNGGLNGRDVIDRFIDDVKDYLKPGGKVQLVQSSLSDNEKTLHKLQELGFETSITARKKCFFEEIVVITAILIK